MSRGEKTGKFRSKLEHRVSEQLDKLDVKYEYENKEYKIDYTVPATKRSYLPDFILQHPAGETIYIEVKGIWDYQDRYKHLLIKQQHPDLDIRFVFQRAGQRIRRSSKTTYRDICEGSGKGVWKGQTWRYSDKGIIPKEWLQD